MIKWEFHQWLDYHLNTYCENPTDQNFYCAKLFLTQRHLQTSILLPKMISQFSIYSVCLSYLNLFMLSNSRLPFNEIPSKYLEIVFNKFQPTDIRATYEHCIPLDFPCFFISSVMRCQGKFPYPFFIIQVTLRHFNCCFDWHLSIWTYWTWKYKES